MATGKWRPSLAPPSASPEAPKPLLSDSNLAGALPPKASEGGYRSAGSATAATSSPRTSALGMAQSLGGPPTTSEADLPYKAISPEGPRLPGKSGSSAALQQQFQQGPHSPVVGVASAYKMATSDDNLGRTGAACSCEQPVPFTSASAEPPWVGPPLLPGAGVVEAETRSVGAPATAPLWEIDATDPALSPRQGRGLLDPHRSCSGTSDAGSSSVAFDVVALNRAVYVRAPLGSFKEPLIHMKLREFARSHHGVFGTCTLNEVAMWILCTQFLAILVALMACPPDGNAFGSRPFIQVETSRGVLFMYSFCSLPLTYLLALKFAGPRMLDASRKVAHVMTALLVCIGFSIQIIHASKGLLVCAPGQPLACLKTDTVLFINVMYTQLQLVMFLVSMVNTLYWPRLYQWWFRRYSVHLWHLVKKHKIKLDIPETVKRSVDAAGPRARSEVTDNSSTGMYMEAHGHSVKQWLQSWGQIFCFWRKHKVTGLGPVSVVFYVGQVDEEDLPHGFGRWQSDAFHGESIVGYWHHGQPMGPFKSREFGTGSGFMCIRIAWCKAKKGVFRFDTTFGISDAECCVSGAFFRKFPRVTMYAMDPGFYEDSVPKQLMGLANELMGYSKPTAAVTVPREFEAQQDLRVAESPEGGRAVSDAPLDSRLNSQDADSDRRLACSVDLERGYSGPKLMWQASKLPAAVRKRAQGLFKWRSDHQKTTVSKDEYFKRSMKLVIDRMDPHLPNFGITNKTELHITVDAEQGLYVAGWVPASELLNVVGPRQNPQQVDALKGDLAGEGEYNGSVDLAHRGSLDSAGLVPGSPDRTPQGVKRKISFSQTRAKGLHQRLGQVKQNIKQVDIRRPFKSIHHGEKPIDDFLQDKPRIRRQTCDQYSKGLTVRVRQPVVRPVAERSMSDFSKRSPAHRHCKRRGSDILDPVNQLNKPFAWTEEVPELRVDGWKRAEEAGLPEAMVFVHGYNTNDVQSMQIMAQMAAFGNFPSYIKPFLFTWPAGENFLQFFDARENAKNPQLHAAFTDFLRSLRDNGIRQLHLLAHSLGSRMLIMSLHRIEQEGLLLKLKNLEDIGASRSQLSPSDQKKLHIVSLNFLNPEFFLEDFVASEYSFLRQYCSNISIFCDAHDGALWWSELFSGKQAMGRSVFGLYARPHYMESGDDVQADLRKPPLYASSTAFFQGYEPQHMQADTRDWLDVDVIDMTWLGHNVHSLRHSYWSLNREVIEDLRELIVTRKRARQRTSRLDRREGNVWVYRVAPSSLTSIFDSDI